MLNEMFRLDRILEEHHDEEGDQFTISVSFQRGFRILGE